MVATDFLILHLLYSRYIIIVLYGCKVTASLCQIVTLLEKLLPHVSNVYDMLSVDE